MGTVPAQKVVGRGATKHRSSPADCTGAVKVVISGGPDEAKICTSHAERQNLTMRMQIRPLTRLTNAFSKKFENHRAAVALHFASPISARFTAL
jgi:hypothetical protein